MVTSFSHVRLLLVLLTLSTVNCSLIEGSFEANITKIRLDTGPLGLSMHIDEKNRVIGMKNIKRGSTFVISFKEADAPMAALSCTSPPNSIQVLDNGFKIHAPLKLASEDYLLSCSTKNGNLDFKISFDSGIMKLISKQKNPRFGNPKIGGPDDSWYVYDSDAYTLDGLSQIVMHNIHSGEIKLISKTALGRPGDGNSLEPKLSKFGNWILFKSNASNFPGANGKYQIYVKNLFNLSLPPIIISTEDGIRPGSHEHFDHNFSPDENYVLFVTSSTNYPSTNGRSQVYVKKFDDLTAAPILISFTAGGIASSEGSEDPHFSPDGKNIIFATASRSFPHAATKYYDEGPSYPIRQIYLKDFSDLSREPILISSMSPSVPTTENVYDATFSPDGKKIMFSTSSSDFPAANLTGQVYIKDLADLTIAPVLISGVDELTPGEAWSTTAKFLPNGNSISFRSKAPNFPGANGYYQIYLKDITNLSLPPVLVSGKDESLAELGDTRAYHVAKNGTDFIFSASAGTYSINKNDIKIYAKSYTNLNGPPILISTKESLVASPTQRTPGQFSPNGTKIVFTSTDASLTAANGSKQIYLLDYTDLSKEPLLISGISSTVAGSHSSYNPVFSPDGNNVLFISGASNFIPNTSNSNIFAKDIRDLSSMPVLITGIDAVTPMNGLNASPSFSPDGNLIVFHSKSTKPLGSNGKSQIYVKDFNDLSLPPVLTSGIDAVTAGNEDSVDPKFSPDSNKIVFTSSTFGASPLNKQIYVKDYNDLSLPPVLISGIDNVTEGNGDSSYPAFSPDGTKIAFSANTDNFPEANIHTQIYIKDYLDLTSPPILVSGIDATIAADGTSTFSEFSPDGNSILFTSLAPNLPGQNGQIQIYIKDLLNLSAEPLLVSSTDRVTAGIKESLDPHFSPDGSSIMFYSDSPNFPGANGIKQLYVIKIDF